MKPRRLRLFLMAAGLLAAVTSGCQSNRNVEYHYAQVRFLNAMMPERPDTVSTYVVLDGQTVLWGHMWEIGSTRQRQIVDAGVHHRVQVMDRLPGEQGARVLLSTDLRFDPERNYTCVLTGMIPDSGADTASTALLVPDDLHYHQNNVAIRLVNAGVSSDSCRLTAEDNPDFLITGPAGRLQSTEYVVLSPGHYLLNPTPSIETLQLVVDSGSTGSLTVYYIGTPKYIDLPRAPHGVLLFDNP